MNLLANYVLLGPLKPTHAVSPGGIVLLPNQHRPWVDGDDQQQYRVLGVGPGKWVKPRRKGRHRRFIQPEVKVGDRVLVDLKPGIKETFDDHSGRILVDAGQCLMVF
jgi:co-chaperonin GroES (HSP10)